MTSRPAGRRRFLAYFGAGSIAVAGIASTPELRSRLAGCRPTPGDALGPFYVSGTPILEDLNRWGKPGEPMAVSGLVRDADDPGMPVAHAALEVWQTDGTGRYAPQDQGAMTDFEDADIDLRGTIMADANGAFAYRTVIPAAYESRPRHIHYKISAKGYKTLITQHYLSDGDKVPGGDCRSGPILRTAQGARFDAPTFYLAKD